MTDETDIVARRLRDNPDRVISVPDQANELGIPESNITRSMEDLTKYDGFFNLGNDRVMFTGDSDIAAFEIFKTLAINITFDEYIKYREQPHLLMRLSRDRIIASKGDPEKLLQYAIKEKQAKGE